MQALPHPHTKTAFTPRGEAAAAAYAVALGIFDGVHKGHQALLKKCVQLGREHGVPAVAVTFVPHPAKLLRPKDAPLLIEPLSVRLERMAALGLDAAYVLQFDGALASMAAEDFVHTILGDMLHARVVVVGYDFAFGKGQRGGSAMLEKLGAAGVGEGRQPFVVHCVPAVTEGAQDDEAASSTRVRARVEAGDMQGAAAVLGRPFCLYGTVEGGLQRGRELGFPTANLRLTAELVPRYGVYAAWAHGSFGKKMGAVSIGVHPTFEAATATKVETYLLDYEGPSFYDTPMHIELVERVRGEEKFADVPALLAQMHCDCAQVRHLLGNLAGGA